MQVELVASTKLVPEMPFTLDADGYSWQGVDVTDADELGELAGRGCYLSWGRPNPKTRENEDYLAHILEVQHESVLAHATATFYVSGISRALSHELVRSRFLVFSQESQRYVAPDFHDCAIPPLAMEPEHADIMDEIIEAYLESLRVYDVILDKLKARGVPKKQRQEVARAVLPNCTPTSLTLSGNHRAFRDFIKQRYHVAADAEIRDFAYRLLIELRELAPNTYQDIPEQPYGTE